MKSTHMYAVQSEQPIRVILELNSETKTALIEKRENLPLSKKQIFISLDPYCPQAQEADLQDTLTYLIADGFKNFVVNNPAFFIYTAPFRMIYTSLTV